MRSPGILSFSHPALTMGSFSSHPRQGSLDGRLMQAPRSHGGADYRGQSPPSSSPHQYPTHLSPPQALSQAFVDGQSLRTYRHAPNTGSRKSWAAGDACARAVWLSLMVKRGEMGYNSVLTVPTCESEISVFRFGARADAGACDAGGFYDVSFKGKKFEFQRPFGSYVMENVLFKISYPAEFHAQVGASPLNDETSRIDQAKDLDRLTLPLLPFPCLFPPSTLPFFSDRRRGLPHPPRQAQVARQVVRRHRLRPDPDAGGCHPHH